MKVTSVNYSKVFSLGNYENEKIGVEIELQEGDNVQIAMQQAKQYVEFNHKVNGFISDLEQCEHVINNPDNYTGNQVKQAIVRKSEIEHQLSSGKNLLT
jgi:hypothetical protein